jgi:hypothetical protein
MNRTTAHEDLQANPCAAGTERAVPDNRTVNAPQPQAADATPNPPENTESAEPKKGAATEPRPLTQAVCRLRARLKARPKRLQGYAC